MLRVGAGFDEGTGKHDVRLREPSVMRDADDRPRADSVSWNSLLTFAYSVICPNSWAHVNRQRLS